MAENEFFEVIAACKAQGWRVEESNGNRWKVFPAKAPEAPPRAPMDTKAVIAFGAALARLTADERRGAVRVMRAGLALGLSVEELIAAVAATEEGVQS